MLENSDEIFFEPLNLKMYFRTRTTIYFRGLIENISSKYIYFLKSWVFRRCISEYIFFLDFSEIHLRIKVDNLNLR